MDKTAEQIVRRRMHGLYLSRRCEDISDLSRNLLGLHCWFHRNVAFSAVIRGAGLMGWRTALTKTWLYRGTLHGVVFEDLPMLLALHAEGRHLNERDQEIADKIVSLMADGVYSRAEMRRIFAGDYDQKTIDWALSPWGGIFCGLARLGKVAFRDMASRDFDLIDAEPTQTCKEVLPELFRRFLVSYGPATLADAAWFFGLQKERKSELSALNLEEYPRIEYNRSIYYSAPDAADPGDIPEVTLLSGFDPLIESYTERSSVLPPVYKKAVILKSGICLPSIAVNGQVAGLWNIKKGEPTVEFFTVQPKQVQDKAFHLAEGICWQTQQYV